MEAADDIVGSFPAPSSLVSEEVDLPRNGLTMDTEHCALPGREKIDWSWLEGV